MKRVILLGRAATGKDFLRKHLQEAGLDFQVSYTTRPARMHEINGKDYFFITQEEFQQLTEQKAWHEHVVFNDWHYGTLKSQFSGTNRLFIMSPNGLQHLTPGERKESLVVYLNIKDSKEIVTRLKQRGWSEAQVQVRMQADDAQFSEFVLEPPGIQVTEPWFDPAALVCKIIALISEGT